MLFAATAISICAIVIRITSKPQEQSDEEESSKGLELFHGMIIASATLTFLATLATIIAYFTGINSISGEVLEVLETSKKVEDLIINEAYNYHAFLGKLSLILISVVSTYHCISVYLAIKMQRNKELYTSLVLKIIALILIGVTSFAGGELVFKYGIHSL